MDVKFDRTLEMDSISDYEFIISKIKATVKKEEQIDTVDVYAKIIRYDRIKESIFCYWSVIYEEEFKNKTNIEMSNVTRKVSIEELKLEEKHKKSVFLRIQNNDLGIFEKGTEIHFIELEKYIKEYGKNKKNKELNKWNDIINLNEKEILLISVVYTDKIHK